MEFLERVLDALAVQDADFPWEVYVVDSGSSDGTLELLAERQSGFPVPLRFRVIDKLEFDHGDTRNMLAAESTGDLLAYLSQDAIPSNKSWLRLLARNFEDALVGGAYCRNVPRTESWPLTKVFTRSDPNYTKTRLETRLPDKATYLAMSAVERRVLYSFNNVASAIRRELWERHPFPRTTMGEDVLMARAILEAGYTIVYETDATVDHSHDYEEEKSHWRGEVDARFNAEWLNRICIYEERDIEPLVTRLVAEDVDLLRADGVQPDELHAHEEKARALRTANLRGTFKGSQAPKRYPRSFAREDGSLGILFVLSADAPPTSKEMDSLVLQLAEALAERGHDVTVLTLASHDRNGDRTDGERNGVRLVEVTAPSARRCEELFGPLLTDGGFDVVHFTHLTRASAGLVGVARANAVATLVTCGEAALVERDQTVPDALALADLRVTPTRELRERYLATGTFEPHTFLYLSRLTTQAIDLTALAREMEFRYRGQSCVDRTGNHPYGILLDAIGVNATPHGPTDRQGEGWILLRPGARAEFSLEHVPAGPVTVVLEQYVIASEQRGIRLGGWLFVDGAKVGFVDPPPDVDSDQFQRWSLDCEMPVGARRLVFAASGHWWSRKRFHMRICRVTIHRRSPTRIAN